MRQTVNFFSTSSKCKQKCWRHFCNHLLAFNFYWVFFTRKFILASKSWSRIINVDSFLLKNSKFDFVWDRISFIFVLNFVSSSARRVVNQQVRCGYFPSATLIPLIAMTYTLKHARTLNFLLMIFEFYSNQQRKKDDLKITSAGRKNA